MPTRGIAWVSSVQCSLMIDASGPGIPMRSSLSRVRWQVWRKVSTPRYTSASAWRLIGSREAPRARESHQLVARPRQQDLHLDDVKNAALVLQRRGGDLPTVVQLAQQILARHAHVLEEHLVELGVPADLAQRPHGDARALHVDQQ